MSSTATYGHIHGILRAHRQTRQFLLPVRQLLHHRLEKS